MSRQSGVHVNGPAGGIATFRSRSGAKPYLKKSIDVIIGRLRVSPPQVLAHHIESGPEQIESPAKCGAH